MLVNNVFALINKFNKEEDQLSAGFGFILKNNRKMLDLFLRKVGIRLTNKELKLVDIETQIPYDSGGSIIDLQLTIYNNFLVFVESKLYRNEEGIFKQLKKYAAILHKKRMEYNDRIRLVYVNKQPIPPKTVGNLRKKLDMSNNEFFFFSWEKLIKLTRQQSKKEIIRLFREYVGDTMYSEKQISEQKVKHIEEVLVVYTSPEYWELTKKKQIAVQKDSAPDAKYLAFLRTHRKDGRRSAITHIAEVKFTRTYVPRRITYNGLPELIKRSKKRGHDLDGTHKEYHLGNTMKLYREIPQLPGEQRGQVYFKTKMSELLREKSIGKIKKIT